MCNPRTTDHPETLRIRTVKGPIATSERSNPSNAWAAGISRTVRPRTSTSQTSRAESPSVGGWSGHMTRTQQTEHFVFCHSNWKSSSNDAPYWTDAADHVRLKRGCRSTRWIGCLVCSRQWSNSCAYMGLLNLCFKIRHSISKHWGLDAGLWTVWKGYETWFYVSSRPPTQFKKKSPSIAGEAFSLWTAVP